MQKRRLQKHALKKRENVSNPSSPKTERMSPFEEDHKSKGKAYPLVN